MKVGVVGRCYAQKICSRRAESQTDRRAALEPPSGGVEEREKGRDLRAQQAHAKLASGGGVKAEEVEVAEREQTLGAERVQLNRRRVRQVIVRLGRICGRWWRWGPDCERDQKGI